MQDIEVIGQIDALVAEEQRLREGGVEDPERLRAVEIALDRCWDLLRQRRALRAGGHEPDEAEPRDAGTVEGYVQ